MTSLIPTPTSVCGGTCRQRQLLPYQAESGDDARARQHALEESAFTTFAYSGTDVAHKVEQLYGDSKAFDETPRAGTCDLVFVDGSHAYSYVVSDTRKALRMVRPGGLVLWHDYGAGDHLIGVHRALNELGTQLPLVHLAGTTLVAYRAPVEGISGAVLRQTASAV